MIDPIAEVTREYMQGALDLPIAYLSIPHIYHPERNPLDVEFFWDEPGFGTLAKINLRDELLEAFEDDPEEFAEQMLGVINALRKLADEIEIIHHGITTNTPVGGGDITPTVPDRSTSLATSNSGEAGTVAPPKPDETPVAAGADESWKRTPHTHRIPRASFPPFTSESAVDREDDSDEFAFPRSRRIVCSASSDGQFTIHRFGDPGITLTAAEARTVFEFLEDAQPIFERICK